MDTGLVWMCYLFKLVLLNIGMVKSGVFSSILKVIIFTEVSSSACNRLCHPYEIFPFQKPLSLLVPIYLPNASLMGTVIVYPFIPVFILFPSKHETLYPV